MSKPLDKYKVVVGDLLSTILKGHFYAYYIPLAIMGAIAVFVLGMYWLGHYIGAL